MSNQITLLDPTKHADLKITTADYSHLAGQHILPISLHEFAKAATEHPIVFVKNSETGEFQPVVMLGLKPEENLRVVNGQWRGNYIPNIAKDYPLGVLLDSKQPDKVWIGIIDSSPQVSIDSGEALFDSGEETDYFKARREALIRHFEEAEATKAILKYLASKDIFIQQTLSITVNDEQRNINGLYVVSEAKLNDLKNEDFLELRKRGLLGPIYGHLTSLNQVNVLAQLKTA